MGLVRASTEVNIEELKGLVSVIFGEVAAELNVTPTTRRKGDVRGSVEAEDERSVNDEGASNFHGKLLKEIEQRDREVRAIRSVRERLVS